MTRKDYVLIANALRLSNKQCARCMENENYHLHISAENCKGCKAPHEHHDYKPELMPAVRNVAEDIADALATDNPRFDREHFLAVVRGEKDLNSRPVRKAVN